jgi:putative transposase
MPRKGLIVSAAPTPEVAEQLKQRRRRPEQAVQALAVADRMLAAGADVDEVCRALQISRVTYSRWRRQLEGLTPDQAKRLKGLEQEIATLRRLLANAELERDALNAIADAHRLPALPDDTMLGAHTRAEDVPWVGAALAGLSKAGMQQLAEAIAVLLADDDQAEDYGLATSTGTDAPVPHRQ